jgi:D-aspartate ligase
MPASRVAPVRFACVDTPVVVVNGQLGALAIMRSLGPLGVPLYCVSDHRSAPAMRSRYCRERFVIRFDEDRPEPYLNGLLAIGRKLGRQAILIATSDETTQFVADHSEALREHFTFQDNSPVTVRALASKREMFQLALQHGVSTPNTSFPQRLEDVLAYAEHGTFPVMLKGIYGNRLQLRTRKKMEIVHSPRELIDAYRRMEDPESPNLMIQELIPGDDDQVYIFNGYFDGRSDCLAAFTGYKVRQFPVHVGCASLGECRWVEEVAQTTIDFMKAVGYQGILDIGYRRDPRDGRYKVLDINPRVGQAFRLFVAENDHDVVKALYLDLTGQKQPPVVPREGRRWAIEDYDLISSMDYYREGTLRPMQWLKSYRGVEELAWFDWRDPGPLLELGRRLSRQLFAFVVKRVRRLGQTRAASQPAVAT